MKRTDEDRVNDKTYSNAETRNAVSHIQAAESLHEISVNTPTLRDQFAMSALQGLLANQQCTPLENERQMGFPDNWTNIPGAKDRPRYKALGNSMAVPVMRWIGKRISPH